ncbi:MAG: dystroglycan-type cadherin-like domain repeat protein [Acidimicrobiaceae bacterium]|nr:dystroglycan-type cadherin-like domain repeat protein [Acidimicrobiaceae bacterium]
MRLLRRPASEATARFSFTRVAAVLAAAMLALGIVLLVRNNVFAPGAAPSSSRPPFSSRPPSSSPPPISSGRIPVDTAARAPKRTRAQVATQRPVDARVTIGEWSRSYLLYLGEPAARASDPRLQFLERWAAHEGTFDLGNSHNPLDTEMGALGAHLWNPQGVRAYDTLEQGLRATRQTMGLSWNRPILRALQDRKATTATLARALAESNWTGYGQRSWAELNYASRVSDEPVAGFGLKLPSVSILGRVVDPLGRPVSKVCVAALPRKGPGTGQLTSASGTFGFPKLVRAAYRLQITDCRHDAHEATPVYYDMKAARTFTTRDRARATVFSSSCSPTSRCPDETFDLSKAPHFGTITPLVTWAPPAAITFGTRLSRRELDARSSLQGTFTYTPRPGTVLAAGEHILRVTIRPEPIPGLKVTTATAHLVVKRALPALNWPAPAPIPYGAALSAAQLDARAAVPGSYTYSPKLGAVLPRGRQNLHVVFRPRNAPEYAIATAEVTLTVTGLDPNITRASRVR